MRRERGIKEVSYRGERRGQGSNRQWLLLLMMMMMMMMMMMQFFGGCKAP
jgi:hypothetical protein